MFPGGGGLFGMMNQMNQMMNAMMQDPFMMPGMQPPMVSERRGEVFGRNFMFCSDELTHDADTAATTALRISTASEC